MVMSNNCSNKSKIESRVQQVSNVETECNLQDFKREAINLVAKLQTDILELVYSCTTSEECTKVWNMLKGIEASVLGIKASTTSVPSSKLLPNSTMPPNKKIVKRKFYSTKRKQANKILKKYKKPSSQEAN